MIDNINIYNFGQGIVFSFTANGFLSNFIPILFPESFMLVKKAVYNGLSLELYTPFDF